MELYNDADEMTFQVKYECEVMTASELKLKEN